MIDSGRLEQALETLATIQPEGGNEAEDVALARKTAAAALEQLIRFNEAIDQYTLAREYYGELGDDEAASECNVRCANLKIRTMQLRDAQFICSKELDRARKMGWRTVEAYALQAKAEAHYRMGQNREAVNDLLASVEILSDLGREDEIDRISSNIAMVYLELGCEELAEPFLKRAAPTTDDGANIRKMARDYMNRSVAAWLQQDYDLAREMTARAFQLGVESGNIRIQASAQTNFGLIYLNAGDYRQAKKMLLKAWQSAQSCGDSHMVVGNLTALAITSIFLNEPAQALEYATLSAKCSTEPDDVETLLLEYYLAIIHLANDNLDLAIARWAQKPVLPRSVHLQAEVDWMCKILEHVSSAGFKAEVSVTSAIEKLAASWRAELEALDMISKQ